MREFTALHVMVQNESSGQDKDIDKLRRGDLICVSSLPFTLWFRTSRADRTRTLIS